MYWSPLIWWPLCGEPAKDSNYLKCPGIRLGGICGKSEIYGNKPNYREVIESFFDIIDKSIQCLQTNNIDN